MKFKQILPNFGKTYFKSLRREVRSQTIALSEARNLLAQNLTADRKHWLISSIFQIISKYILSMIKTAFQKTVLLLCLLSSSLFLITSCSNKVEYADPLPASIENYVYAFTSGVIAKNSSVRVRFSSPIVEETSIGSEAQKDIVCFSPSIKGKYIWEDDHTILVTSENHLKSGTNYVATVQLSLLFDNLPEEAKSFQFDFQTRQQGFDVSIYGLQAVSSTNLRQQELRGNVVTNDLTNADELEKVLRAYQGGKNLDIEWTHDGNQRDHAFLIKNIVRSEKASEIRLEWNGSPMSVDKKGEKKIEIPALGDFKVINAAVRRESGNPYLQLQFSDPLLVNQDLRGMVRIKNQKREPKFVINGNLLNVYPNGRLSNTQKIEVNPGILNSEKVKMKKSSVWDVFFTEMKPQIRLVRQGVIMPNSDGLIFPFEAVSLNAVEVEVFKIYDNNILQFLQTNELSGQSDLYRVGRVILQKKVPLENLNPDASTFGWERYALDLSKLFEADASAIYQIRLGFRPEYSSFACEGDGAQPADNVRVVQTANRIDDDGEIESIWDDYYGINGSYDGFRWNHREDPCKPAYYNYENFVSSNVIASNLGIIAKGGKDKSYFIAVTDILTAQPIPEAVIEFYDYQQQLLRTTVTNGAGIVEVSLSRKPFAIVAKWNGQNGYLKLADGNSLSLSRYDVSGAVSQKGMKGFIYGERGVWRPGDSLFLNFVLEDKMTKLPGNHPITFELYDSRGQLQKKEVIIKRTDNVYAMYAATATDAPTGNWVAKVKAGGATFDKVLKIETIKPNRLKVKLDFGKEELKVADMPLSVDLQVNWLHGAPAQNLKTKVEMQVSTTKTKFDDYNNFIFDDPTRNFSSNPNTIFDGEVDVKGNADFQINSLSNSNNIPGKLVAKIKTRAFEKGGDFSTNNVSIPYSPFPSYAGIRLPKNKYKQNRIEVNKEGTMNFVLLDEDGKYLKDRNLDIGLYRLEWRWWWDRGRDNLNSFNTSNHFNATETVTVTTNSKGEAEWSYTPDDWGRYLVRVCDSESGHCTGDFFYAGNPWYGSDEQVNRQEAAMMTFSADKEKYVVGEEIKLNVPASESSRVLVTLENGAKVLDSFWAEAKKGDNTFSFLATEAMAPTIYAHVALVQPHGQIDNDLPIRMYGVVPLTVENPKTILKPQLKMPDELAPEQTFTVEISEENDKPMAYTIAMVDDGLLDLTNFKTPNPHAAFYAREALGVKTWDVYDHVLGAYGGELERVLSIGGDGENAAKEGAKSANRFKPVVRHLGPFYLNAGKTAKHKITVPNYVGSVRTMVVASNSEAAYGRAEKTTAVKKPLMVLATLPRVLGPTETLRLPVSVFAMDKKVKNVAVSISESSGLVNFIGGNSQSLTFSQPGEEMVYFDLKIGERVGIANFKITAKGGGETTTQDIEIQVRNPNPFITDLKESVVEAGQTWEETFDAVGIMGTNKGILEVSNIPPIDLGKRLDYLIRYPHGCIEQTTSSGFPQLFVDNLLEMTAVQRKEIPANIKATLTRLKKFQTAEGGFSYWPGQEDPNAWGSNYGGHFMLEAKEKGYTIPAGLLERWVAFQKKRARNWKWDKDGFNDHGGYYNNDLMQSYRLYTLAKADEAELGAMNRMREITELSAQAKWRLAAAYALVGNTKVAKEIINQLPTAVNKYRQLSGTYGSDIRDEAMILETLVLLDETSKAALVVKDLSTSLSTDEWMSTQTTAYALLGISKFAKKENFDKALTFDIKIGNGATVNAGAKTPMMQVVVPVDAMNNKRISIKNTSGGLLYARLILSGQPLIGDQTAAAENLTIAVNYLTTKGKKIDPSNIAQGTDFIAEVTVSNTGARGINYEEMALTQIFPSGWEITNSRMDGFESGGGNSSVPDYQDIRDDRVYSYFDIRKNVTQTYRVQLNAAYPGQYYLPTVACSAMYDDGIFARQPGQWVEVMRNEIN
ncbi:MAG: hypothetical protein ACI9XO_002496 [Paraglaciecola sp.]